MVLLQVIIGIVIISLITIYRIDKIKKMRYYGHNLSKRSKPDAYLTKVFIKKLSD